MDMLRTISHMFNVPMDWLMYGKGSERELNAYAAPAKDELTLYLPVTISSNSLVDEMTRTLALVDARPNREDERTEVHRECLQAIIKKLYFYEQYAANSKLVSYANSARKRMMEAVRKCHISNIPK